MTRSMQTAWLALGIAAALLDSNAPAASQWLARCNAPSTASLIQAALRIDQHMLAFPLSMAVMTGHCLVCVRDQAGRCSIQPWLAFTVMLASMPFACALAALFASAVSFVWQPLAYALTMLLVPLICIRLIRAVRKQADLNGRKLVGCNEVSLGGYR